VYDKPGDDRDHVHTELLGGQRQAWQLHDLTCYQAHDAERRVPAQVDQHDTCSSNQYIQRTHVHTLFEKTLLLNDQDFFIRTVYKHSY